MSSLSKIKQKQIYMSNFNKCSCEFIQIIVKEFPDDIDVIYAKNTIYALQKTNPRILIQYWLTYIYIPNKESIHNLDISFIVNDDYKALEEFRGGEQVREVLVRLRQPISNLNDDIKKKASTCILNMSKLSFLYFS